MMFLKTKICKECGLELPLEAYHKDANGYLGRKSKCKKCISKKKKNMQNGTEVVCEYCGKTFLKNKYSAEHNKHHYCSRECKDNNQKVKITFTCDCCGKTSTMIPYRFNKAKHHFCSNGCKNNFQIGKNHPRFDETLSEEDRIDKRQYQEYYDFIQEVLIRDNYTCQLSGQVGGNLVVHHLNGYHWFKEGRIDPNNAIVLTKEIHDEFHKIYGKKNNTLEQFLEFKERYVNTEII